MGGGIAVAPGVIGNHGFTAAEELDQRVIHGGGVEQTRFRNRPPAGEEINSMPWPCHRACGNAGFC
jgi:hypothetical protein